MQKNIGTCNSMIRITCGLVGLAWSTARMVRYPCRGLPWLIATMSAMKVASGVTRYCPVTALIKKSSQETESKETRDNSI
ncbi:YgaP family membrane protein [Thermoflavimicrobium dichotomicum]|uniref:Inner membrane protein YgaP-like transmembrane domain-containing protein n=1 Tax=Thermoflavimicrobium dichotomicum TaxID=46223 RepID=A0A1I3JFY4_9BACL|nr:DUF2892 domain-containing protein [Thermoflavimicrobium dichotomicum]SFI59104.1 Protein of unknown function [Thermoflavimicrobium dichotomicum]